MACLSASSHAVLSLNCSPISMPGVFTSSLCDVERSLFHFVSKRSDCIVRNSFTSSLPDKPPKRRKW